MLMPVAQVLFTTEEDAMAITKKEIIQESHPTVLKETKDLTAKENTEAVVVHHHKGIITTDLRIIHTGEMMETGRNVIHTGEMMVTDLNATLTEEMIVTDRNAIHSEEMMATDRNAIHLEEMMAEALENHLTKTGTQTLGETKNPLEKNQN
jgi:hypothetical protein